MAAMIEKKCACCGKTMKVRLADHNRGWGKFCSKRCKAVKQEARTGQYANLIHRQTSRPAYEFEDENGEICRPLCQEELHAGGYGSADWNTPFGDDKW